MQEALNSHNTTERFRLDGGGMKVKDPEMEEKLLASVMAYKANGVNPTWRNICQMALQLSNKPEFKASMGWVAKFVRKNGLSNSKPPKPQKPKLEHEEDDMQEVEFKLNEEIEQNESEDDVIVQSNTSSNVLVNDSTSTTKPMWKRNPDGSFSCTYEGN